MDKPNNKEANKETESTCDCDQDDPDYTKITDTDAEQYIAFENELQNLIYVKYVKFLMWLKFTLMILHKISIQF